jgi:hypothetical protein
MFESGSVVRSLLLCIVTGVLFQANSLLGWVHLPGNTMQIARGISGGLSFLGIFGMAYFHGRGLLDRFQIAAYLSLTAVILIFALTGLLIANIIQPIALALIGYTLGASRPPWVILGALFVLVAILHAGKYTMRDIYFAGAESAPRIELASLPSFYSEWFSYGFSELGGLGGIVEVETKDDSPTTVFERSGNLHMLVLVQHKSPEEVPFLDGLTYAPIPQMLIPRFLMPDKAISHAGNILLSVNYGLVDTDGARNVSIGWPLIAEAYANFGYIGVFTLSILLSCGYAYATRLSSRVPITSFRFVAALVIMAGVTNENTLGVFIGSQFQAVVGVALASFFLMRRQPNPYAEETENQETRAYNAEGQHLVGNGRAETGDQSLARPIQLAADGGVVRTMPVKTPQRLARWMPRRIRAAVLAQQAAAADGTEEEGERLKDEETKRPETPKRPRQLAVPYQLYRRYRG